MEIVNLLRGVVSIEGESRDLVLRTHLDRVAARDRRLSAALRVIRSRTADGDELGESLRVLGDTIGEELKESVERLRARRKLLVFGRRFNLPDRYF